MKLDVVFKCDLRARLKEGGRMWEESGEAWAGLGMRVGMSLDRTTHVVL